MVFTRIGMILAWVLLVIGSLFFVTGAWLNESPELRSRLLGPDWERGTFDLDSGLLTAFAGICLGVACEISRSLQILADKARSGN